MRNGKLVLRVVFICALLSGNIATQVYWVSADDPMTAQTTVSRSETRVARTNAQQAISLAIPVKARDQAALDSFVHDLYNPSSPIFHHYITPAEYTKRFFDPTSRKQVADFLRGKGLKVSDLGLGSIINATGSVAEVERAFNLTMSNFKDASGRIFYSNDITPAIPTTIASRILGILGLNDAVQEQPHYVRAPVQPPTHLQGDLPNYASGCPDAISLTYRYMVYTPNQIRDVYNLGSNYGGFPNLNYINVAGQGQTVALFELDDYRDSNIVTFQNCFDTSVPLTRVPVAGGAPIGSGEIEVELDIDAVVGIAPRLVL